MKLFTMVYQRVVLLFLFYSSIDAGSICLSGDSEVITGTGKVMVRELQPGTEVLTLNWEGELEFSPILFQLHAKNSETATAISIQTANGRHVSLTPDHLILVAPNCLVREMILAGSKHAKNIKPGDCVYTSKSSDGLPMLDIDLVTTVEQQNITGLYAPVTKQGTILVDHILLSCYAYLPNHYQAHNLFAVFHYFPPKGMKHLQSMFYDMSMEEMEEWLLSLGSKIDMSETSGICFKSPEKQNLAKRLLELQAMYSGSPVGSCSREQFSAHNMLVSA